MQLPPSLCCASFLRSAIVHTLLDVMCVWQRNVHDSHTPLLLRTACALQYDRGPALGHQQQRPPGSRRVGRLQWAAADLCAHDAAETQVGGRMPYAPSGLPTNKTIVASHLSQPQQLSAPTPAPIQAVCLRAALYYCPSTGVVPVGCGPPRGQAGLQRLGLQLQVVAIRCEERERGWGLT